MTDNLKDCENCGHVIRYTHHGLSRVLVGDCVGCIDCNAFLGIDPENEVIGYGADTDMDIAIRDHWEKMAKQEQGQEAMTKIKVEAIGRDSYRVSEQPDMHTGFEDGEGFVTIASGYNAEQAADLVATRMRIRPGLRFETTPRTRRINTLLALRGISGV